MDNPTQDLAQALTGYRPTTAASGVMAGPFEELLAAFFTGEVREIVPAVVDYLAASDHILSPRLAEGIAPEELMQDGLLNLSWGMIKFLDGIGYRPQAEAVIP